MEKESLYDGNGYKKKSVKKLRFGGHLIHIVVQSKNILQFCEPNKRLLLPGNEAQIKSDQISLHNNCSFQVQIKNIHME